MPMGLYLGLRLDSQQSGGSAPVLPPLSAITGESNASGISMGRDNALQGTVGRGLTIPSGAFAANTGGDWSTVMVITTGAGGYPTAAGVLARQMIACAGAQVTGNAGSGTGILYILGTTRELFVARMTTSETNASVVNWADGTTTGGTPVATGIILSDQRAYLLVIGQSGNFPVIKACDLEAGTIQTWTGASNKVTGGYYSRNDASARTTTSNYTDFFSRVGMWGTTYSTNLQGIDADFMGIAQAWSFPSDATIASLATGATSLGSISSLRFWNRCELPASGTSVASEATNKAGSALTVTTAVTLATVGSPTAFRAAASARTGGLIRLTREIGPYIFPLMPGRTTGRVYFDGVNSAPAGYAIYGRLRKADLSGLLLAATQLTASHAGGAFSLPVDGITKGITFYREIWVGPVTSTAFGSDGHTYVGTTPMQVGVRFLYLHQSQGSKQIDMGTTGNSLAPAPASGGWLTVRYGNSSNTFTTYASVTGLTNKLGPRELVAGAVGDGLVEMMNRIATEMGCAVECVHLARAGHSINAFAYDRTTTSIAATGTGTSRAATLSLPINLTMGVTTLTGVEPGSVVISWSGGSATDAANAAMTGSQLTAANPQAIGAQGILSAATINYSTGVLSMTFASDPGAMTIAWMTRYDTTDGNQTEEATPDKYTIWGSTAINGNTRRILATMPRHGFSFFFWGGATSNISGFQVSTDAAYISARDTYATVLDALRDRVWAESAGTNPPMLLGQYGRGSNSSGENNAMRRARMELSLDASSGVAKRYDPTAASGGSSGAIASAYRWYSPQSQAHSLLTNIGEHQDSQTIGGQIMGEMDAWGAVSLLKGDQNLALGPRVSTVAVKSGAPDTLEVTYSFPRAVDTALVVDTVRGGAATTLYGWVILVNPTTANAYASNTGETINVSLNTTSGKVEIQRPAGAWPTGTPILIRHKGIQTFMTGGTGGSGNTATDEAQMATALWGNGGGFSGIRPGAETVPITGLFVTL